MTPDLPTYLFRSLSGYNIGVWSVEGRIFYFVSDVEHQRRINKRQGTCIRRVDRRSEIGPRNQNRRDRGAPFSMYLP